MSEEAKKAAIEQIVKSENHPVAFYRETHALTVGAGRGWDAHASHTAAIREKAEALVAKHIEVCEADVFEMNFGDGTMMIGMSPKDIYQIGYAAALFGLGPELTALKAALEGKQ